MARLLFLTIVLIVYGSLYPWRLRAPIGGHSPIDILLHSWPAGLDDSGIRDVAVNIIIYAPLGCFAFAVFRSVWRTVALGFGLSLFAEIAQVYIATRVPSLVDVASDTVGTALGIGFAMLWPRVPHPHARRPDAALMVCCWALYQCFPLIPRARPALAFHSPVPDVVLFSAEALSLVLLAQGRRTLLGILLLLVPLKAVIYTRVVTLAEVACCAAVFVVSSYVQTRARLVAALLILALVIHGLSPFHFVTVPHAFEWVPFQASFSSEWEPALTVMLGKVFAYGALLWVAREAGASLRAATLGTAVLLGAIEAVQMYLPGRASEIIDPLIALILGWVFGSLKAAQKGL